MTILQRTGEKGSMHKKILISPIAVMTGSANLTFSGSNLNDESINHTTSNNKSQYESVLANARTTLKDAEKFDFDYEPKPSRFKNPASKVPQTNIDLDEVSQLINDLENGTFDDESRTLECKATYATPNPEKGMTWKDTADLAFREIVSMMNSDGGHLFCGVVDQTWEVIGIDSELAAEESHDAFLRKKVNVQFHNNIGAAFSDFVRWQIRLVNGKNVLIFSVKPSRNKKVWFKPRGNYFKKDIHFKGFGAIYNRSEDNVNTFQTIPEFLTWSQARFGNMDFD